MLFTVYEEEPDGLAGAVEGGEVGDVVRVGGDEHHVRGVSVAARLEEGGGGWWNDANTRGSVTVSPPLLSSSDSWSAPRTARPTRSIPKEFSKEFLWRFRKIRNQL